MTQQVEMLYGPLDGTFFEPHPGQTITFTDDGEYVYFYRLDDDYFVLGLTIAVGDLDWAMRRRALTASGSPPPPQTITIPSQPSS